MHCKVVRVSTPEGEKLTAPGDESVRHDEESCRPSDGRTKQTYRMYKAHIGLKFGGSSLLVHI